IAQPHRHAMLSRLEHHRLRGSGIGSSISAQTGSQMKSIKVLIGLDHVAKLIRISLPGNFDSPTWRHGPETPLVQALAEQFMYIYNKWQKEGEPPDEPRAS
ncbi:MAG: hypothetical protein K2Q09_08650, partial [Phycisphaerales bacterium]|nr:hypothetical protein [Phycisphaerales bacterium]